ncbi:hypothetical protein ATCC90586_009512 [Pythium insidiosum]|nr:hypothetical protein ATCC90586_009512 [Pythium insidiosum]
MDPQQQPQPTRPKPGAQYYEHYACASAAATLKRDGDQRPMTPLEQETLRLWIQRQIHLPEPPTFLKETHTGAERDEFADYHRDHLGFRLAKSKEEREKLLQLFRDALTTLCEPKSRIATLRFVHPDVRDKWDGFTFHFGTEKITLTATDSLSSDTPRAGLDAGARQLLYHVFLRGHHRLGHRAIRAIGSAAARMPVLDVELVESIAASDYSPPKWKLTFDRIACPPSLERIRRLEATLNGDVLVFLVMHPRAARRAPCLNCLSVRHATKDCSTRDPATSLKTHTLAVSVPAIPSLPKITATPTGCDLDGLLGQLREQAAPEVARRLAQEERAPQAHVEAAFAVSRPETDWLQAFPSPALDESLTCLRSPSTLIDWLTSLNARVICTPATGGCLYFAIHGARTRSLHGANMTLCPTHVKEGGFYKRHICLTLDRYLEPMLLDGTVALADFKRRCFQTGVPDDPSVALKTIRAYYQNVRKTSIKSLEREQWGGDEEIFAAVWYLRDPIFVLAVDTTGSASLRAVWLDRPHPRGPERIVHHLPTPGEAYETLRVFLHHRVMPTILVHTTDHFNCLRFPEAHYHEWTSDDKSGLAMRARMDQALAQLGWVQPRPETMDASQALVSVCKAWSLSPPSFLALLRSLPYPEATISLLPQGLVRRLGTELNALAPPCAPPSFVTSDDPESAHFLWTQLLVLIAVAHDEATDDAIVASISWLRQHEAATVHNVQGLEKSSATLRDWFKGFSRRRDRLIAVEGTFDMEPIFIVNVYAPNDYAAREGFFRSLAAVPKPRGLICLGGDFNCVLDPDLDRTKPTSRRQVSPALAALLVAWDLVDTVADEMHQVTSRLDVQQFQETYHTFYYATQSGGLASARLDRWYISRNGYSRVGAVDVETPVARADHDAVRLELRPTHASRRPAPRRRTPQLRYPLPPAVADTVIDTGIGLLRRATPELVTAPAGASVRAWDDLKTAIRRESLRTQREALAAATARARTRVRRLRQALRTARLAATTRPTIPATPEGVTRAFASLTLDPLLRHRLLRARLIAVETAATNRAHLRCMARHAGAPHETTRALFRRISLRRASRSAYLPPVRSSDRDSPATRVAADWRPILRRQPRSRLCQEAFFARLPPKAELPDLAALADTFTEAEVRSAIAACPRGKACGPDGLSNDWYRDVVDAIAPLLASLFSIWFAAGIVPTSFRAALVCCIPKTTTPKSGLDYRPISLLNTDYKLYSRILLLRIQRHMPSLVSPTQFGFVPGRQVHDALDVWTALQRRALTEHIPPDAMAVLLDFSKAYDSLDRNFLTRALRRLGFPEPVIQAVHSLHLGTTARFVVDGDVSGDEVVSCGIRQGCPLAPTLFVLAVDTLYDLVNQDQRLPGVALSDAVRVSIVGYADDTTAYLQSPAELRPLSDLLRLFSDASGLGVNPMKSTALYLWHRQRPGDAADMPFPIAGPTQQVRYLGRQISTIANQDAVWLTCLQQIRARLHLASLKTMDVLQRVQVARAVILPKLLYVARHDWPSVAQLDRLQRFLHDYVWFGSLTDVGAPRRAWLSADIAALPSSLGGIQLPHLRDELLLLSARTVARWISATDLVRAAVGAVLRTADPSAVRHGATVGRHAADRLTFRPSIAQAGRSVIQMAASVPRLPAEQQELRALLPTAGKAPLSQGHWEDDWYVRDYSPVRARLDAVKRAQHVQHGKVNVSALLASPPLTPGLLVHPSGRPMQKSDLGTLASDTVPIIEILELARVSPHTMKFRLRGAQYPYAQVDSFRLLCDALVMCYPDILEGDLDPSVVVAYGDTADKWRAVRTANGPHLIRVDSHGVEWSAIHSLQHSSSRQRLAFYRVKLGALTDCPTTIAKTYPSHRGGIHVSYCLEVVEGVDMAALMTMIAVLDMGPYASSPGLGASMGVMG